MKKYVSIKVWRDLASGHLYNVGEPFPFDGKEVPEERIQSLTSTQNKAGFALVKAVEVAEEEKPTPTDAPPKKAAKPRKKA